MTTFGTILFFVFMLLLIIGLVKPSVFTNKKTGQALSRKQIAGIFGALAIVSLFIVGVFVPEDTMLEDSNSKSDIQNDYNYGAFKGKPNDAVAWFEIDGDKYIPIEGKSFGGVVSEGFTMAEKPAVSIETTSYKDGDAEANISLTLRKSGIKEKGIFESINSFADYNNKILALEVTFRGDRFTHNLYDTFNDTSAKVIITKIVDKNIYAEYSGKLYNNMEDKKSINVKGRIKFKL